MTLTDDTPDTDLLAAVVNLTEQLNDALIHAFNHNIPLRLIIDSQGDMGGILPDTLSIARIIV